MNNLLEVQGLTKHYPEFFLDSVSFSIKKGRIVGLIGRNGAGKTTTLKSLLHLVHPDAGEIRFFDLDWAANENEIKQRIGFASGAVNYYGRKPISELVSVTRKFYSTWDDEACRKYMQLFELKENKTPLQLSEGMRVKLNLTLALSHRAELLILDEPTSGLDPVSRSELLDVFRYLKEQGISILFSTHLTTDLENCADDILYLKAGKVVFSGEMESFLTENQATGRGNHLEKIMIAYEKEGFYEKLTR